MGSKFKYVFWCALVCSIIFLGMNVSKCSHKYETIKISEKTDRRFRGNDFSDKNNLVSVKHFFVYHLRCTKCGTIDSKRVAR